MAIAATCQPRSRKAHSGQRQANYKKGRFIFFNKSLSFLQSLELPYPERHTAHHLPYPPPAGECPSNSPHQGQRAFYGFSKEKVGVHMSLLLTRWVTLGRYSKSDLNRPYSKAYLTTQPEGFRGPRLERGKGNGLCLDPQPCSGHLG